MSAPTKRPGGGISFADLVERKRTMAVRFSNGATLEVTYRPDHLTPATMKRINESIEDDTLSAADLLTEVLTEWELEGPYAEGSPEFVPDGEPVPISVDHLQHMPGPYLAHILNAVIEDANPDPKRNRRSSGRS